MDVKGLTKRLPHSVRILFQREHTAIGRERLALLLSCYIPIMIIGVAANFIGITEPSAPFFNYTHTLCLAAAVVIFCLFYKHKIDIAVCLAAFTIIGQSILSIEMTYCALHPSSYYIFLIIANTVLLALNTMVSVAAYMKKNTIFLGFATIVIYIACAMIADDALLKSFIVVFTIAFCFVCIAGTLVATTTGKLEKDNENFRKGEVELLHILRLRRNEVRTFLSLSAKKYNHDGTKVLLESLDTRSRRNLLSNVENYLKTRDTDLDIITKAFPEFTPSEREICRLVLQGKRLGEICQTLDKNESNINSQRANMRRKLNLMPTDNLQKKLHERLDDMKAN